VSNNRSQPPKPSDTIGVATKPLHLQYAELVRLREAVQEAAAAQASNENKLDDERHGSFSRRR
jgi:hypothetical protein